MPLVETPKVTFFARAGVSKLSDELKTLCTMDCSANKWCCLELLSESATAPAFLTDGIWVNPARFKGQFTE